MASEKAQKASLQLTGTTHRTVYPAISALRPELSQAGRTILITGGATGIGFAIAKAFCQAGATRVIIVGRRESVIRDAVSSLVAHGKEIGSTTEFLGRPADVADLDSTARLWANFEAERIVVDVLVLNAASISGAATVLERGLDQIWYDYVVNARALIDLTERFYKQKAAMSSNTKGTSVSGADVLGIFETVSEANDGR